MAAELCKGVLSKYPNTLRKVSGTLVRDVLCYVTDIDFHPRPRLNSRRPIWSNLQDKALTIQHPVAHTLAEPNRPRPKHETSHWLMPHRHRPASCDHQSTRYIIVNECPLIAHDAAFNFKYSGCWEKLDITESKRQQEQQVGLLRPKSQYTWSTIVMYTQKYASVSTRAKTLDGAVQHESIARMRIIWRSPSDVVLLRFCYFCCQLHYTI